MKRILLYNIVILLFILGGCKDDNPVNPGNNNIIFSSSFEINGNASFDGWNILNNDTINVTFANDVPSGGGTYSVTLENVNTIPVQLTRTAAISTGTNVYTLIVNSKYQGVGGSFSFGIKNQQARNITTITDSAWKQYTVVDTLTAVQGDSIIVILSGGVGELIPGRTYYDLVTLREQ